MGPRVVALVLALAALAAAADTPEAAADAVLAAFRAGGDLRELAARDDPDPWLVADELCARGEHDAAEAFARAAPRKDTEKLPEFVASRRGKRIDPAARAALAVASDAFADGDFARATKAVEDAGAPPDDPVAAIRVAYGRGLTLRSLSRPADSADAFLGAATKAQGLGWLGCAAQALYEAGASAYGWADFAGALAAWERALELTDDPAHVAAILSMIGGAHNSLGNYPKALDYMQRALKLAQERADRAVVAAILGNMGLVHFSLCEYPKALECQQRGLELKEELGDRAGIALVLGNIGNIHCNLGDYPRALDHHERSLGIKNEVGDRAGIAITLGNIGNIHGLLDDHLRALQYLERALGLRREVGDRAGVAAVLLNIGAIHRRRGDYPRALDFDERALKLMEDLGDRAGVAIALGNIGSIHEDLGDLSNALTCRERALALAEHLGNRASCARQLMGIGSIHEGLGDYRRALDVQQRALKLMEDLGDRAGVADTLANIGVIQGRLGDYPDALASLSRSLKLHEELASRRGQATVLLDIGGIRHLQGEHADALAFASRALALAREIGSPELEVHALSNSAGMHLEADRPHEAAAAARSAVERASCLFRGLADEEGSRAREVYRSIFENGIAASRAVGDAAELSYFLESGRAVTLLESLAGRASFEASAVPRELRAAEAEARAAESVALAVYRAALDSGGDVDPLWKGVDGARSRVIDVTRRIQREAKAQADVLYPQASPLDRIQATLADGDALVTYGLLSQDALALVATRDSARIVQLGRTDAIAKAAAALQAAVLRPDERGVAAPPHERLDFVAKRLRALVVEPLGLKDVKRLLVAPHGELAYVPFALLAPGAEIAYVPSGTTYGVLLDDAPLRGEGVLAFGDPPAGDEQAAAVFRGGEELAPLPASRAEAQAIGDVVLVGKDATETGFARAVASRARWRAVHLACHGLVRADLPELSCLALGADAENDGFLTVLEVFRLKIPADLVVLSACETAKGKVYRAEGVIGLARAFMLAGSPRVICSLWKVDDAATKELMTTFYKEWKPGVGAAAALRKAQQHVTSQEKWKDPYFWAAWQLWGLPN